jgi:hypothetical protein
MSGEDFVFGSFRLDPAIRLNRAGGSSVRGTPKIAVVKYEASANCSHKNAT